MIENALIWLSTLSKVVGVGGSKRAGIKEELVVIIHNPSGNKFDWSEEMLDLNCHLKTDCK